MRAALAFVLILLVSGAKAQPYIMDGNALYQRLLRQDPSAITYILGVYDGVQIAQFHAPSTERLLCAPPGMTPLQLAEVVRRYLETDPAILGYPAGVLVLRALVLTFPCGVT
jgi:hypothetical protein